MTALGSWYFSKDLGDGQRKALLRQMCEDLAGKSEPQIAHACKRWRTSSAAYFPTSGQLLELMKNPYDAPRGRTYAAIPRDDGGQYITPERAAEVLRAAGLKSIRDERHDP